MDWIWTLDVLYYPWTESFYYMYVICCREIYVYVDIFFLFSFFFYIRAIEMGGESRARARVLHLSFLWRRIKRNSRKYKFIIVRAEPFFPPHMRGKHFSAISTSSHARGVKELPITAKLSLLLLIQWFESAHATKDLRKFYQFFWIIQHAKTSFVDKIENPVLFIIEAMMIRDKIFLPPRYSRNVPTPKTLLSFDNTLVNLLIQRDNSCRLQKTSLGYKISVPSTSLFCWYNK